jgi:phytanoyl-CoA hydroxylase
MDGQSEAGRRAADHAGEDGLDGLIHAYERDGFVNAGKVLSDDLVDLAITDLEGVAEGVVRGKADQDPAAMASEWGREHFKIDGLRALSSAFVAITACEPLLRAAAALTNSVSIQLWSDTVHYKSARTGGLVDWHQDGPHHWGVRPVHKIISAWVALDDADEESGCLWMARGSYKWGKQEAYLRTFRGRAFEDLQPPENTPEAEWRGLTACPVRKGEVHFHHAFTWHGSPPNRSPRPRRGYSLFLLAGGARATEKNGMGLAGGAPLRDAVEQFPLLYRASRRG